jgi:hypothetical protein
MMRAPSRRWPPAPDVIAEEPKGEQVVRYTILSKWTVLLLTLGTAALIALGSAFLGATFGDALQLPHNGGYAALSFVAAFGVYALAWIVGFLDSLQESRYGWSIGMVVLIPFLVGPILYSVFGPRNTK